MQKIVSKLWVMVDTINFFFKI